MSIKIHNRIAQIRCYQCGTPDVQSICHHCQRAMCLQHSIALVDQKKKDKPLSVEFTNLGLEHERACGEVPVHCEGCHHVIRLFRVGVMAISGLGLLLIIISFILGKDNSKIGIVGVLIGAGMIILAYLIHRREREQAAKFRPPLPLIPHFEAFKFLETLSGHIVLSPDGRYQVTASPVKGVLSFVAHFGTKDHNRVQLYRKKYKIKNDDDLAFHAGFIVLRGQAGLNFGKNNGTGIQDQKVIGFSGRVGQLPFLCGKSKQPTITSNTQYCLSTPIAIAKLPLQLVPYLVQEIEQRALALELQWTDAKQLEPGIDFERIDLLELNVPIDWGRIENATDGALVGKTNAYADTKATHTIQWKNPNLTKQERVRSRLVFFMRFEKEIDSAATIYGRVKVSFRGALSHVEGIELYYFLGKRRKDDPDEPTEVKTQVICDFELSLAGLRYQQLRVVPDQNKEQDRDKRETITIVGVRPDYRTIIRLITAMSDEGFYVKKLIEDPPRTSDRVDIVNRSWDIVCRFYDGVYPINCHIIVAGEAPATREMRPYPGITKITATLQGTYASVEMEALIENCWKKLADLIEETFQLPKGLWDRQNDWETVHTHDQSRLSINAPISSGKFLRKHTN